MGKPPKLVALVNRGDAFDSKRTSADQETRVDDHCRFWPVADAERRRLALLRSTRDSEAMLHPASWQVLGGCQ